MKVIKPGVQRLFEQDAETAAVVSRMLIELEKHGMDAVRRYSRQFDDWDPPGFRLSSRQVEEAIAEVPRQAIDDTDFCQANVRSVRPSPAANDAAAGNRNTAGRGAGPSPHPGEFGGLAIFPADGTRCSVRRR